MKFKQTINDMKKWIILVLIAVVSYWGINNIQVISSLFKTIYNVLFPFILGGIVAFILNIPMKFFEKKLVKTNLKQTTIRIISILLSLLIFVLVLGFVSFLLIPELVENIKSLINNIPTLFDKIENIIIKMLDKYPDIQVQIKEFFSSSITISDILTDVLNYILNGIIDIISNLVSGVVTIFTSLVFSIYMLSQKEYLIKGTKKVTYALLNKVNAEKCIEIGTMSNKVFSKFISGQCVEAIILGIIIFIISSILRFPYALIISVLTAITALIPIFGALIAMVVGAILIAITSPIQSLIFIIVFLIVQQIEGNFIYPKVVGKSVGLSPMWTLLAITVGGSLFGVAGMIIGLPLASIVFAITKELVDNKLKEKKIIVE